MDFSHMLLNIISNTKIFGDFTFLKIFPMFQCGMSTGGNSDSYGAPTPQGSYIENTIIVQYDPLLQEVWDQARKIRCTW